MNEIIVSAGALQVSEEPATLAEMLLKFVDYIHVRDITLKGYAVSLRCFMEWLANNGITQPERADIKNYVKWLASPHEKRTKTAPGQTAPIITFSAGTQATYLRAVKMFFEWCEAEGLYKNIAKNIKSATVKTDKHKRNAFSKDDVNIILNSIDRDTIAGKRDYAMFMLGFYCGLRIIEMQRANIGSIEKLAGNNVLYIFGKGRSEADAYQKLDDDVYAAIQDYLNTRTDKNADSPLFCGTGNRNKGRLEEATISKIIKTRLKAAGYDSRRLTAHSLRHTAVTNLLKSGASIREAQIFARHSSPETTCIYIHDEDTKNQNFSQRIYNYVNDTEQTPVKRIENAARTAAGLSYNAQKLLADEIEALVNKYKDLERSM